MTNAQLVVAFGLIVSLAACGRSDQKSAAAAATAQPVAVEVLSVQPVTRPRTLSAVATLSSVRMSGVAGTIGGRLARITFQPGEIVATGQMLAQIDDTTAAAEVRAAKAQQRNALQIFQRDEKLLSVGGVSSEQALSDASALDVAEADLARAKTAHDATVIRAPFAGVLGFRHVSVGAVLAAGQAITEINQLDRLQAQFSLPQEAVEKLAPGMAVDITVPGVPGSYAGKLSVVNVALDSDTHMLALLADIANSDGRLKPGMFAMARVELGRTNPTLLIPTRAVMPEGGATTVWCVGADGKAQHRVITLGALYGDWVAVTDGLTAGDRIVVTGGPKLREGAALHITEYHLAPQDSAAGAVGSAGADPPDGVRP